MKSDVIWGIPRIYFRYLRWIFYTGVWGVIAGLVDDVFGYPQNTLVCLIVFYVSFAGMFFVFFLSRRYRKTVIARGFDVCCRCGFHLKGLPPQHRCPECGTEYDIERVHRIWRKVLRCEKDDHV
jgi:hypothetical protein